MTTIDPPAAPPAPPAVSPEPFLHLAEGFQGLYALTAALELRLFARLAEGHETAAALAAAAGASPRGVGRLLDVLVAMGLVRRAGTGEAARHRPGPEAEAFLVEGRPSYLGGYLCFLARRTRAHWECITDALRAGAPAVELDRPEQGGPWWAELVDLLFPWNYPAAMQLAPLVVAAHGPGVRMLDVAAGSGVWGIALARADPAARVVAVDLPPVLERARRNAERMGVTAQLELRPGDIRRDALGDAEFDAAMLGQICHSEGEVGTRRLLAGAFRALRPGGTLLLADVMPREDRGGPLFTLLFALEMYLTTREGDTFTRAQYATWLDEAGFRGLEHHQLAGQSVLLARRPAAD